MIKGRVWLYGDHVNTDLIIPGRYLDDYDLRSLSEHAMEDIDISFSRNVKSGDIIVAGRNFGCGSSREQAPAVLRQKGVGAVLADSVARIFYRNAINIGLPVVICPRVSTQLRAGDVATVDMQLGSITRESDGLEIRFAPPPDFLLEILDRGGLVPYMRERLSR